MANEEHVEILKQGAKVWNKWREKNRDVSPDLFRANLTKARLSGTDLSGARMAPPGPSAAGRSSRRPNSAGSSTS